MMKNHGSGFAEMAGARLRYEVAGEGRPVVLIHGFGVDRRLWDPQFEALAGTHRVLRYDLRGFGESSAPTGEPYSHGEDLAALLAHLALERPCLIGLSMGGWIATNFALEFPAAVRGLVLVDAALIGYRWSAEWTEPWAAMREEAAAGGPGRANDLWRRHPLLAAAREQAAVAAHLERMIGDYSGWHWTHRDPHRPIEPLDIERLEELDVPALVMVGERDMADFRAIAEILGERIPGARKVVIPAAGHLPNLEAPERFLALVEKFLASSAPA